MNCIFVAFLGYKNRRMNAIVRSAAADIINFKVADSKIGIELFRNLLGGYQRIKNATVVGESSNTGKIQTFLTLTTKMSLVVAINDIPLFEPCSVIKKY